MTSYPNYSRSEVNLGSASAIEAGRLIGGANARNIVVNELHHSVRDESRDDGAEHLATVHRSRRHLGVEAHLLVRDVIIRLSVDVVTKRLHEHHSLRVSLNPLVQP